MRLRERGESGLNKNEVAPWVEFITQVAKRTSVSKGVELK